MPSGVIISCCCMCPDTSFNGHCRVYATCLGSAWYDLVSGLTFNENMQLKHPIPLNTSLNSLCSHCVISALIPLSLLLLVPGRKYFMLLLSLSVTIGLSSFSNFETLCFSTLLLHQFSDLCLFCICQGYHLPPSLLCCN